MICEKMKVGDGFVIVCRGRQRNKKCAFCNRVSTKLCDHILGKTLGGTDITCDVPLCDQHAFFKGANEDYCPKHAPEHKAGRRPI